MDRDAPGSYGFGRNYSIYYGVVSMNKIRKQKLFIFANTLTWCIIGAVCWFLIGNRLIEDNLYALCFIGYPGFFLGIIGGFLYVNTRGR